MFNLENGGTTQKNFTVVFLDGLYSLALRQAVRDRGPETVKSAIHAIYGEYEKFAHYTELLVASNQKLTTTSSE